MRLFLAGFLVVVAMNVEDIKSFSLRSLLEGKTMLGEPLGITDVPLLTVVVLDVVV